jgi:hypothetical protein
MLTAPDVPVSWSSYFDKGIRRGQVLSARVSVLRNKTAPGMSVCLTPTLTVYIEKLIVIDVVKKLPALKGERVHQRIKHFAMKAYGGVDV